ncbi:hypothetical protein Q1695_006554 [Nippostrongylus brasiliensis]|nr:hypothetical protein Q1695_006554 [Nippostrongylus brasiliensis]
MSLLDKSWELYSQKWAVWHGRDSMPKLDLTFTKKVLLVGDTGRSHSPTPYNSIYVPVKPPNRDDVVCCMHGAACEIAKKEKKDANGDDNLSEQYVNLVETKRDHKKNRDELIHSLAGRLKDLDIVETKPKASGRDKRRGYKDRRKEEDSIKRREEKSPRRERDFIQRGDASEREEHVKFEGDEIGSERRRDVDMGRERKRDVDNGSERKREMKGRGKREARSRRDSETAEDRRTRAIEAAFHKAAKQRARMDRAQRTGGRVHLTEGVSRDGSLSASAKCLVDDLDVSESVRRKRKRREKRRKDRREGGLSAVSSKPKMLESIRNIMPNEGSRRGDTEDRPRSKTLDKEPQPPHQQLNGLAKSVYIGVCNFAKAEEKVTKRSDFRVYHQLAHRPLLDDLEQELPLIVVYRTANGSFRHYPIRRRKVGTSSYYYVDYGDPKVQAHASLDHLVRYYQINAQRHPENGEYADQFPWWEVHL